MKKIICTALACAVLTATAACGSPGELPAGNPADDPAPSSSAAADGIPAGEGDSAAGQPAPPDRTDLDFSDLGDLEFWFASGAGAWSTTVTIQPDGAFAGYFADADMGVSGAEYPGGTLYECRFRGTFTALSQIGDYEYAMRCEGLTAEREEGLEEIRDGVRVIAAGPYGFDDAGEFRLYLPGKRVEELPEAFRSWVWLDPGEHATLPFYGLYNIGGEQGFRAYDKEDG